MPSNRHISAAAYSTSYFCGSDANKYKYGFNGKEKDEETNVEGGDYNFGARIYDSRLGRWLGYDPESFLYCPISPYVFALDNGIYFVDHDGGVVYGTDGEKVEIINKEGVWTISGKPNDDTKKIFEAMLKVPTGIDMLKQITTQKIEVRLTLTTELVDKDGKVVTDAQGLTETKIDPITKKKYKNTQIKTLVGESSRFYGLELSTLMAIVGSHEIGHIMTNGGSYVNEDAPTYIELKTVFEFSYTYPGSVSINKMMPHYLQHVDLTLTEVDDIKKIHQEVVKSMLKSGTIKPNKGETSKEAENRICDSFNKEIDEMQTTVKQEKENKDNGNDKKKKD